MNNSFTSEQSKSGADGTGEPARKGVRPAMRLHHRESFFQPVPAGLWCFTMIGILWGFFTPNPMMSLCSLLMLPLLVSLLWFRGEPPILLLACFIQWLQATMGTFSYNFQDIAVSAGLTAGGATVGEATWLSMAGVLVLAVGMRLALFNWDKKIVQQAQLESRLLRIDRIFVLYLFAFVLSWSISLTAFINPRLTQPMLALGNIHWMMVFLLAYAVILNRRQYGLLALAVGLEVVSGFTGFFADFKSIFFILLVVMLGAGTILKGWRLFTIATVAITIVALAIFWTAIKPEYRSFLNQGTGNQAVTVSFDQRLTKLRELIFSTNTTDFEQGFNNLLLRISYVEYFALTIQNVPSIVPYEHGKLWWGSIKQVLTPRLFFPDKAALDDSERTSRYTGNEVAGAAQGTSIGIGYFGESYIDFGPVGMFAPIFLLGMLFGLIYRLFITQSQRNIFGLASAVPILVFNALLIETSNIKIVGGTVMDCLVMGLFLKFGGDWLWDSITHQRRSGVMRRKRGRVAEERESAKAEIGKTEI